jgi:hypothetical protein
VAFVVVFARSSWLTVVRRRVTWRGREILLSPPAGERSPGPAPGGQAGGPG